MDQKFGLLVNTVAQIGASVMVLMDKFSANNLGASVVSGEEVATCSTYAPRRRSLSNFPKPGRRQTVSPREVSEVCPQVVAPLTEPVL